MSFWFIQQLARNSDRGEPSGVVAVGGAASGFVWSDLNGKAQVLKAADHAMDLFGFRPVIEVIGTQVLIEGSVLQHVICGS
jgi:hypothetical protein